MNQERLQLLTVINQAPARLNAEETAWYLGFLPYEIPLLVSARLLKPLGHPPANGCKYFSTVELQHLRSDPAWLSKASDAIVKHWKTKNSRKSINAAKIK